MYQLNHEILNVVTGKRSIKVGAYLAPKSIKTMIARERRTHLAGLTTKTTFFIKDKCGGGSSAQHWLSVWISTAIQQRRRQSMLLEVK
jgi:hypothetical protein